MTSTQLPHAARVTATQEAVGLWIVAALIVVAVAACAFALPLDVADGVGPATFAGP